MDRRQFFGASVLGTASLVVNGDTNAENASVGNKIYPTVNDMKHSNELRLGDHVITQGYHQPGDGGHGQYIIVRTGAGVDDGGSIHDLSQPELQAQLVIERAANVKQFGAKGDGVTDDHPSILAAVEYLFRLDWAGGELYFPKSDKPYVMNASIDAIEILFRLKGITLKAAGHYLPNDELVRNVTLGIVGEFSTIKVGQSFSDSFLFRFGRRISSERQQAIKFYVENMEFVGPGSVGHTSIEYLTGPNGFQSENQAGLGCSNNSITCIDAELIVPGSRLTQTNIRLFNKALLCTYGFGLEYESGSIQYCNYGVHAEPGFTNLNLGQALEIELCAVAVFVEQADNTYINATIIEANQIGILMYIARFVEVVSAWFEGNKIDVIIRSDTRAPSIANRQINFKGCVGPQRLDSNACISGLYFERCAMGSEYKFTGVVGNVFKDIVFSHCTIGNSALEALPMSLSALNIIWPFKKQHIKVIGEVSDATLENFGLREPLKERGSASVALPSPQKTIQIKVPNITTTAKIIINAFKKPAIPHETQIQSMRYVGVLSRVINEQTFIAFSEVESQVTNYEGSGKMAPITIDIPQIDVSSNSNGDDEVGLYFATGTPFANTADTLWEIEIMNEAGEASSNIEVF